MSLITSVAGRTETVTSSVLLKTFFCNFPNIDSSFRNPETALRDSVTFYLQISEALTHLPLKLSGNLGRATEQLTPATE